MERPVHSTYFPSPTVRLERLFGEQPVGIYAKLDNLQLTGSTKERTAASLLEGLLESGGLATGGTVVESTSGNLGMALARQCALLDLRFIAVVDERANQAALDTMRAFGAQVDLVKTPPDGNRLRARVERVKELLECEPGAVTTNQYANPSNPKAHADSTFPEICDALGAAPTKLFVATSTTGTLLGCLNAVRALNVDTQVIAVDSAGSALFGGTSGDRYLPGLGAGFETDLSLHAHPHAIHRIPEAQMVRGARLLARREGIMAGASTGALVAAVGAELACTSARLATSDPQATNETWAFLVHDGGAPYLPTVYNDDWVRTSLDYDPHTDIDLIRCNPFHKLAEQGRRLPDSLIPITEYVRPGVPA
jgi:cysteine synthase A